jgi:hypothetical protein
MHITTLQNLHIWEFVWICSDVVFCIFQKSSEALSAGETNIGVRVQDGRRHANLVAPHGEEFKTKRGMVDPCESP